MRGKTPLRCDRMVGESTARPAQWIEEVEGICLGVAEEMQGRLSEKRWTARDQDLIVTFRSCTAAFIVIATPWRSS